jgi:predicted RNase H-like nuclease (RuvC/YqgF family)
LGEEEMTEDRIREILNQLVIEKIKMNDAIRNAISEVEKLRSIVTTYDILEIDVLQRKIDSLRSGWRSTSKEKKKLEAENKELEDKLAKYQINEHWQDNQAQQMITDQTETILWLNAEIRNLKAENAELRQINNNIQDKDLKRSGKLYEQEKEIDSLTKELEKARETAEELAATVYMPRIKQLEAENEKLKGGK